MKCCLCGEKLPKTHPGRNNPAPLKQEGECCDKCNYEKVIPERIRRALEGGKK